MLLSGSSTLDINIPSQLVAWALLSSFHSSVLFWVPGWSPLPTSLSWICPSPSQQHCSPLPFSPLVSCLDLCVLGNGTVTQCGWLEINTSRCHVCAASTYTHTYIHLFIYLFIFWFFFFWERISPCCHGCSGTYSVDQAGLEISEICLLLPSEWWV